MSCPAVTGHSHCQPWLDKTHRCELHCDHDHIVHKCVCGYRWTCLTGSLDDYEITPKGGTT